MDTSINTLHTFSPTEAMKFWRNKVKSNFRRTIWVVLLIFIMSMLLSVVINFVVFWSVFPDMQSISPDDLIATQKSIAIFSLFSSVFTSFLMYWFANFLIDYVSWKYSANYIQSLQKVVKFSGVHQLIGIQLLFWILQLLLMSWIGSYSIYLKNMIESLNLESYFPTLYSNFIPFVFSTIWIVAYFALIVVMIRLSLFYFFIAEGYLLIESIKLSWKATRWSKLNIFLFWLLWVPVFFLWALALFVGILVAYPVIAIWYVRIYLQLKKNVISE